MTDFAQMVAKMATSTREFVAQAVAPLKEKIDGLEQRLASLPVPKDGEPGKSIEPAEVQAMVEAAFAKFPKPKDGQNGKGVDLAELQLLVSAAVASVPKPKDGEPGARGEPGENGRDADPALIDELVAKAFAEMPKPKDGERGPPGESVKGDRGEPGVMGEKGPPGESIKGDKGEPGPIGEKGPPGESVKGEKGDRGEPGQNGKDVDEGTVKSLTEAIAQANQKGENAIAEARKSLLEAADEHRLAARAYEAATAQLKAIQRAPVSFYVNDDGDLIGINAEGETKAFGRVRGEDGKNGEPGKDGVGIPGERGLNALELAIVASPDFTRSYPRGTFACHNGGLIYAKRATGAVNGSGLEDAGWTFISMGVAGPPTIEPSPEDPRVFTVAQSLSDGSRVETVARIPAPLDMGVYRQGRTYDRGDGVTHDGSWWIAQRQTDAKPGAGNSDWRLAVKRGTDGKDAKR